LSKTVKSFMIVSRSEFLLPNLGAFVMGLAWAASPSLNLVESAVLLILTFIIVNLSSAIGAQVNTLSDYALDSRDSRKKSLVAALNSFGQTRLKSILMAEFLIAALLSVLLTVIVGKPLLLVLWLAGISLGCSYSAPPLRLKSRSWLAFVSLVLVLSILPTFFIFYTFTSEISLLFLLALSGLTLTVYAVIVPTETRDYFGDKAMEITTMTVHIGLTKSSLVSIILLIAGGALNGTALFLGLFYGRYPILSIFLIVVVAAISIVLKQFVKLYRLCKEYDVNNNEMTAQAISDLSANNPKWIMLVTQTYSILSLVLLVGRL
jgi:4-hydroxybenzoate polyprenyltransferase